MVCDPHPGAGRRTPLNDCGSCATCFHPRSGAATILRRRRTHPGTMPEPDASASPNTGSPAGAAARHIPTAGELFLAFAKMAVCGFGGVLAWSRRVIVQERGWLTPEEFNEQLALCQVLPGGNILNFSIMYGSRCAGLAGAF